ncbi:hypothetical protein Q5H91_11120 [Sphingomonas sp. KR1UV-12]|uniref:AAA+ ATPase domain-containing protein n=1 Tax=Sphingomonas aurea TaxID=3063994 RepID=A0ABT9ELC1_9SPHN|nr:hypothetical protein [Sphingomonas sp. KR1UV-12]MDP1027767.1 hypothetical protein [Sphingomonas sp. KR1UV-12]
MSRKASAEQKSSVFARVVRQLLDDTAFYTRVQWSQYLGISTPALSQWTNDRTVPRADLLRMVVDLLRTRGGVAAGEALVALEAIMDQPAESISPIGTRFAPSLRDYLAVRSLGEVGESLRHLPLAEQIAVLRDGAMGVPFADPKVEASSADLRTSSDDAERLPPLWRTPRLVRTRGPRERERRVLMNEFDELRRILLVGAPGSGKSSLLDFLQRERPRWRKAKRTSLRHHPIDGLEDWLAGLGARDPDLPLIIDGFDELPREHRAQAASLLGRYADRAGEPSILVASRPVAELDRFELFDRISIAPLSDVDLVAEVTHSSLASRDPVGAERFLCHLSERDSLRSAVRSPLFLQIAWSLFERNAVTPFHEGAVIREYMHMLFERDNRHGFSRVREPWATSHNLLSILGEVALKLLSHRQSSFDEDALASWIGHSSWNVPTGKLLDLWLVHGLLNEQDGRYSFTHRIVEDYLAARYAVASSASALDYLSDDPAGASSRGAIRLACSLTSDATPLLETFTRRSVKHAADYTLLAQMLAQPIAAKPQTIEDSCRALVGWLEDSTSEWKVIGDEGHPSSEPAKWLVCAQVGHATGVNAVSETLRAIHQARSGPACVPLKAYLSEAKSSFLPIFSEALEVEGRLKVDVGLADAPRRAARVAVEALHLA